MTVKTVTDEQLNKWLGKIAIRQWELFRRVKERTLDPEWVYEKLQGLIVGGDWLERIIIKEKQCHRVFFGKEFDLTEFQEVLQKYGERKIREWQDLGLEPHYLPEVEMSQDLKVLPGWKVKPEKWFYEQITKGRVLRQQHGKLVPETEIRLEGITVLIDARLKPALKNGKQMYENDNLLGPIIKKLRKKNKIAEYKYGSQDSRFGISSDEWEKEIKLALAKLLELDVSRILLEMVIEANVIPQLYPHMSRKDDGKTNTWVWHEEFFEGRDGRLCGGRSVFGGLADVDYRQSDNHWWGDKSLRPLVVL